jgi:Bacterial PH domain
LADFIIIGNSQVTETRLATRWPTIGAYGWGRFCGRLIGRSIGFGRIFTFGTLMSLVTLPISLVVYAWQLMPWVCRRYRLTNRRVVVLKGYSAAFDRAVEMSDFDDIRLEKLPGQEWLRTGELIFTTSGNEVFRLSGVPSPEAFRKTCLEAHAASISYAG